MPVSTMTTDNTGHGAAQSPIAIFVVDLSSPVLGRSTLLKALQLLFLYSCPRQVQLVTRLDPPELTEAEHFYHKAPSSSVQINTVIAL